MSQCLFQGKAPLILRVTSNPRGDAETKREHLLACLVIALQLVELIYLWWVNDGDIRRIERSPPMALEVLPYAFYVATAIFPKFFSKGQSNSSTGFFGTEGEIELVDKKREARESKKRK